MSADESLSPKQFSETPDDGRRLKQAAGEPISVLDVYAQRTRIEALAEHYGVSTPKVIPASESYGSKRLGHYSRGVRDGQGEIRLYHDRLNTGTLDDVLTHEFTHHLDHERGTYQGTDPVEGHGPEFVKRWDEVKSAAAGLK